MSPLRLSNIYTSYSIGFNVENDIIAFDMKIINKPMVSYMLKIMHIVNWNEYSLDT